MRFVVLSTSAPYSVNRSELFKISYLHFKTSSHDLQSLALDRTHLWSRSKDAASLCLKTVAERLGREQDKPLERHRPHSGFSSSPVQSDFESGERLQVCSTYIVHVYLNGQHDVLMRRREGRIYPCIRNMVSSAMASRAFFSSNAHAVCPESIAARDVNASHVDAGGKRSDLTFCHFFNFNI